MLFYASYASSNASSNIRVDVGNASSNIRVDVVNASSNIRVDVVNASSNIRVDVVNASSNISVDVVYVSSKCIRPRMYKHIQDTNYDHFLTRVNSISRQLLT